MTGASANTSEGFYWDPDLKLGSETHELTSLVWPKYLTEASDLPEKTVRFNVQGEILFKNFPAWGVRRKSDHKLIAFANGVLINTDLKSDTLPEKGWQFAMEAFCQGSTPNCLCLLSANVHPNYQSLGFSQALLERGKKVTLDSGFTTMIGPVRPSHKHHFPELSMGDYIAKKSDGGEIYDPWLRMHVRNGAKILNICAESYTMTASLNKWQEWTGQKYERSGSYQIDKALAPMTVSIEENIATYCEPNIWVRYSLV